MLTQIESQRKDTLVYELDGFISNEEIEYIDEGIDFMLRTFDRVNLVIYINAKGESLASFIKEFQLGAKYAGSINKIAFLSDKNYWNILITLDNFTTRYKEKYFNIDDIAKAWDWINED